MLTYTALLAALTAPIVPATPRVWVRPFERPRVELWTNNGEDPFRRGDRARVFFRADDDAYITVFRVDTDGRVRVLFPRDPWEDAFARGGREYELEGPSGRSAFSIDDPPGVGYVFAVIAADPFDYGAIVTGDHWDYRTIADGRVRGDPYVALTDLAQRIVPEGYDEWDYDVVPYYVEQHYDYPRFACYDCHAYASWTYWDPYAYDCVRFRVVIYDDPFYYPYRYYTYPYPYYPYGGTRVVVTRPYAPQPRFVFKEWDGASRDRDRFVTRVRERPAGEPRTSEARGRDLGGIGSIPAPRTRDRGLTSGAPATSGVNARPEPRSSGAPVRDDRTARAERLEDARTIAPPRAGQPGTRESAGGRRVVTPTERTQSGATERREAAPGEQRSGGAGLRESNRDDGRRESPRPSEGSARASSGGERERSQPRASGSSDGDRERSQPRASGSSGGGRERSQPRTSGGGGSSSGKSKPAARSPELTRRRPG